MTETCEETLPRIITNVQTTQAPIADGEITPPIHAALQEKDLLPTDHLVDTAYLDAQLLLNSKTIYGVNLVGPTRMDTGWQARQAEGGFSAENFTVDWERQQATCPGAQPAAIGKSPRIHEAMTPSISCSPKMIVDPVPCNPNAPIHIQLAGP